MVLYANEFAFISCVIIFPNLSRPNFPTSLTNFTATITFYLFGNGLKFNRNISSNYLKQLTLKCRTHNEVPDSIEK